MKTNKLIYMQWVNVKKKSHCPQWNDLGVFTKWVESRIGYKHGFPICHYLDPMKPNCSPTTSGFVPWQIGTILKVIAKEGMLGPYESSYTGVSYSKRYDRWTACLYGPSGRVSRTFDTAFEAYIALMKTKVLMIRYTAEQYKWKLDYDVYELLKNFKLDWLDI